MLLIRKMFPNIRCTIALVVLLVVFSNGSASAKTLGGGPMHNRLDTVPINNSDLHYPIHDRRGDFVSNYGQSTYDFKTPPNIRDSVVYDPVTKLYVVYEKIGTKYYRTTTTYTFEEYWQMRGRQSEIDYFKKRSDVTSIL